MSRYVPSDFSPSWGSEAMERGKPTMWKLVQTMMVIGAVILSLAGFQELVAASSSQQTVTLQIDGMTCGGCVKDVKAALAKLPGVSAVEFTIAKKWILFSDYADARALVTFDSEKTGLEVLIKAIEGASSPLSAYKARLVKP
ncbi:MAG: heavy-metal-associated domain-containing protein [Nitrospira sp.]|nr:heavy-metal-associated domain-containing protein [Nitrospira sp.]